MVKHRMDVAPSLPGFSSRMTSMRSRGVKVLAQAVIEARISGQIGADLYERSTERTAYRTRRTNPTLTTASTT
jgi:hypothetical protein